MKNLVNNYFRLDKYGTTLNVEFMAGLTTFLSMCYILIVNASIFTNIEGVSFNAIYIATAIATVFGTLLLGLMARLPIAQSTGLGINAFFVYTCCLAFGFTYANSLVFVLIDGIIFLILTLTGLRSIIFDSLPKSITMAISVGIGLFIAFVGLQNVGIVVNNPSTCVTLASFNLLGTADWAQIMPFAITIITFTVLISFMKKGIKTGVFWAILIGTALYYLLGLTVPQFYNNLNLNISINPLHSFGDFYNFSFGKVFKEGFDFTYYLSDPDNSKTSLIVVFITTSLAFCMLNMFDSLGTLYGCCKAGNLYEKNEKGENVIPSLNKAMASDAIATCVASVCGTSTQTLFMESTSGISAGGKTGLTAIVVAILFFIAMFCAPLAALVPPCAYCAALIYVGLLMIGSIKELDLKDVEVATPAFMTIIMIPFTYNISFGIAFGLLSHVLIKVFLGKAKEIKVSTWVVFLLFCALFLFTH